MGFDIGTTLADMLGAARGVIVADFPKIRGCVKKALDDEADFLKELAKARIDGEIDDDMLAEQLRDEKRTLEAQLLVCQVISKKVAQDAANAAIDVFNGAVKAALAPLVGAGRKRSATAARTAARKRNGKTPLLARDRRLNARADTVDFRDLMYVPTLVEVGVEKPLKEYLKARVPILDQGEEGACTGFGLATVAHFLLRTRFTVPDTEPTSPRMLYAMARRYDEWPGEAYEGSSCRGAMKGWHKHGVCAENLWVHDPANPDFSFTDKRSTDAQHRPLGAYFRVNHKDLVAMHAAISEVGVLYASGSVHSGWDDVGKNGKIPFNSDVQMLGGHAFAIVAYDSTGFWIQNSWGKTWGRGGFGHVSYEDWMQNGTDVWVARLGVPTVALARRAATQVAFGVSSQARSFAYEEVRPHVVSLGNDGRLRHNGNIGNTASQVRQIFSDDFPRITSNWKSHRLVLYAHGGLVGEDGAVQRVAEYRRAMLASECYPLAFIWHSDYWTTLTNMLSEALKGRKPEGIIDGTKDFMLDRLDDALEPIARNLTGKASWDEMKENALAATEASDGGARLVLDEIVKLAATDPKLEIHIVGHSAGSIFHAPVVQHLTSIPSNGHPRLTIESCTLWAPACTMALFEQSYAPAVANGRIRNFTLYTLTDRAERDDNCGRIYNKSLLYLVSHAFENRPRIPLLRPDGEAILGMERFASRSAVLKQLLKTARAEWIKAPNDLPEGDRNASAATSHASFDDDQATVRSTLARIAPAGGPQKKRAKSLRFSAGAGRLRKCRNDLNTARLDAVLH